MQPFLFDFINLIIAEFNIDKKRDISYNINNKMSDRKLKVYLDNCCYNRPFDDQSQLVINIESIAKLYIQSMVLAGRFSLVWSDILEYENAHNPFEERRKRIAKWKTVATTMIQSTIDVIDKAKDIMKVGTKSKDALHLSSAIIAKADYFITTDKKIIKKSKEIKEIIVLNPIDFVKELEN